MASAADIERRSFDEVDSTNAYLRREIAAGGLTGPTLVWAGRQTAGRGRRARRWVSPEGGVWMSLALPFARGESHDRLRGLGVRLGVGVREGVDSALAETGVAEGDLQRLRLKWPNDLVIESGVGGSSRQHDAGWKKVGGLLVEVEFASSMHDVFWMVIGVGVNVNVDVAELESVKGGSEREVGGVTRASATSLRASFGRDFDLALIRERLAERLVARASGFGVEEVIDAYRAWLVGVGMPMRFTLADGTRVEGVLESIDPAEARAVIRTADGRVVRCALESVEPIA